MAMVRVYDPYSAQCSGTWENVAEIDLAQDDHGFCNGSVQVPLLSDYLHYRSMSPGFSGVWVEIDCRDDGLPWVGLGFAESFQMDSRAVGSVPIRIAGPEGWLSDEFCPSLVDVEGPAAAIAWQVIGGHPARTYVRLGQRGEGPRLPERLNGQSIWDLWKKMSGDRGERFRLTATPGKVEYTLDWTLDDDDWSNRVTLEDGENGNCDWQYAVKLRRPVREVAVAGQAFKSSTFEGRDAVAKVPRRVAGLGAAAALAVGTPVAQKLAGNSAVSLRPDLRSDTAIMAATRAELAKAIAYAPPVTVTVNDMDLVPKLRTGALVTARFSRDRYGLYQTAIMRIFALSVTVRPGVGIVGCELGGELWAIGSNW